MAANELDEILAPVNELIRSVWSDELENLKDEKQAILSLIESEKVKAVEEYRQKLNAYWPEGSEEPTLSSKQVKTILDNVLKERSK